MTGRRHAKRDGDLTAATLLGAPADCGASGHCHFRNPNEPNTLLNVGWSSENRDLASSALNVDTPQFTDQTIPDVKVTATSCFRVNLPSRFSSTVSMTPTSAGMSCIRA